MRRPAVLAFSLFAIAASLPAEVRECLPKTAACGHRAPEVVAGCARSAAKPMGACQNRRRADCPKTAPARESSNCRLHPTPPVTLGAQLALPAPSALVLFATLAAPPAPEPGRAGWREAPALRPRASPAAAPRSPRPPPFKV